MNSPALKFKWSLAEIYSPQKLSPGIQGALPEVRSGTWSLIRFCLFTPSDE